MRIRSVTSAAAEISNYLENTWAGAIEATRYPSSLPIFPAWSPLVLVMPGPQSKLIVTCSVGSVAAWAGLVAGTKPSVQGVGNIAICHHQVRAEVRTGV